jgi:hypothetical protein
VHEEVQAPITKELKHMNKHSEYLTFSRKKDLFVAESQDIVTAPGLAFLRVEMSRVRVGMADYLMKVASPKQATEKKSNTVIVLRGNRRQASSSGAISTARVIIEEMKKRGDMTTDWGSVKPEALARMIAPGLKFFSTMTGSEQLQFQTEAL